MKSYATISELIRDLNLDKNNWINRESFRFIRKSAFNKTAVNIKHVPKELFSFKLKCPHGHTFGPDWLKKRHPVSFFYCGKNKLLRQYSCFVQCPECMAQVKFNIPQPKYRGDLEIFGDEAQRTVDGKKIFIYSFISFYSSNNSKDHFENEFRYIKSKMAPVIKPTDWVLHMKELTSKEKWGKKHYLKHLQQNDINTYIENILSLLRKYNEKGDLNIYSSSGIVTSDTLSKKDNNEVQSDIYNSALMNIVRETSAHGLAPKFYFEKTGNDGWAKNLFDGGRLTLLWVYLTNGLPVMSPKFVDPSTSLYLEIADIVSYLVARFLYCTGRRAEGGNTYPNFNLSQLGKVRHVLTIGNGDWIITTSKGYPSEIILKGTSWEKYMQ